MKFLVTGKNGQLGQEFCKYFLQHKLDYAAFSKDELDIADFSQLTAIVTDYMPDVIINCAAYNQVDRAEEDNKLAFQINCTAVANLALIAKAQKIKLVHYSSDYVFDGTKKNGLYTENDPTNPINEYGKSKLAGEHAIERTFNNFLIFRVSWVYGRGQQNFIYKLLEWSKNQDVLQIADDEISTPTSTRTIVEISLKALEKELIGLYHLTNDGSCSRYEWAIEILKIKNINKKVKPISKEIFNLPAKRPGFSAMGSEKLELKVNNWRDELAELIR